MSRYYFDIHDGRLFTEDDTGVELDGPESAREAALKALGEIAKDVLPDGDVRNMTVRVRDENGRRVLMASLSLQVERGF